MKCTTCIITLMIFGVLAVDAAGEGEKYELKEQFKKDEVETADSYMKLEMDVKVKVGAEDGKLPVKIKTIHKYLQKVLSIDEKGKPTKAVRYYQKSRMEAEQPAAKPRSGTTVFEGKTYIIEKKDDKVKAELLGGAKVTEQEEKELGTAVAGNYGKVLPDKSVETGESWNVPIDAIREIFSIAGEAKGSAKAKFAEIKKQEDENLAIVKIETEIDVPEGDLTMHYKGNGKVEFSLKKKRIISFSFSADISVSGTRKSKYGEAKFSGGGTVKSWFKTTPGKGKINLTPPDNKKDSTGEEKGDEPGKAEK